MLLAENPCQRWKIEYFPKVEDHLVAEIFLVWQPKNGGVLDPKAAAGYHKIANCNFATRISCYWPNSKSELGS